MKKFDAEKIIFWQLCELEAIFWTCILNSYACAMMVSTRANQLLPQLLMEQFHPFPTH